MLRSLLAPLAILAATTVLGSWVYYTFFYTGNRRKPPHINKHGFAEGRRPIVWIDWEERHGDRILTFGPPL